MAKQDKGVLLTPLSLCSVSIADRPFASIVAPSTPQLRCSGTLTANLHSVPILAPALPFRGPDIAGNALGHDFIMATWLAPCKKQGLFYASRMGFPY